MFYAEDRQTDSQTDRQIMKLIARFYGCFATKPKNKAKRGIVFYELIGRLFGEAVNWKAIKPCEDVIRVQLRGAIGRNVVLFFILADANPYNDVAC